MAAKDYVDLANLSKDLLVERRKTEWKITFSFWAVIGSLAYSVWELYEGQPEGQGLGDKAYFWLLWGLFAATIVFCFVHLPATTGSSRKDLDLIKYFRSQAQRELQDPGHIPEEIPNDIRTWPWLYAWKRPKYWHCFVPQIVISFILFGIVAALLYSVK